ncbi:hypothetical protein N7457_005790 [Penicillium paradoxum]|uniref:uncharacterized protein n=1 Tax=Penicillium paradoxum TaxID=176176 RepID=UPI002548AD2B|nr:uncharacterized protein N7457_005790 [Penicillium paradoxum]KAJ5780630.1 hypothetical protein N7457_005790 [Penicillium paradoxum]
MPESPSEPGQIQSLRRSVTLPTKLNPLAQRRSSVPNTPEHVIFYHPSAKIVHFAPRALAPIPSSSAPSDFDYPVDTIETLPWRSATERTVATAPLRLEKVHGSTAFLKCGNVVHAILKNSQCWCVDGVSKFVLRIRPLTYYRIEIPYETDDDRSLVQDLKIAFPTILRYEVTPCPFKRTFSVELPNDAMAPRRKKAWQPKDRRHRIPTILEPPLENLSPVSTRSECIDSASTGDDTDGNLTDDSCSTSNKASSAALEAIPDDTQAPTINLSIPFPSIGTPRRSVSEGPPAFTSLLAKFEATTTTEDDYDSSCELKPDDGSNFDTVLQLDTEAQPPTEQLNFELPVHSGVEAEPGSELAPDAEIPTDIQIVSKSEPEAGPGATLQAQSLSEAAVEAESTISIETEQVSEAETSEEIVLQSQPTIVTELEVSTLRIDHDCFFASSAESSHSAEPQSPDSVSTHPTSVGGPDLPEPTEMFNLSNTKEAVSGCESKLASPCKTTQLPTVDIFARDNVANATGMHHQLSMHNTGQNNLPRRFPDAFSDTSPSMTRSSKVHPPSRFLDVSSDASRRLPPPAKATLSNPDLDPISAEFRRRAQATRERDFSPMPPSSALYLPSGDDASSFISKAITLVLIPPAYLLVILLHIAARIVDNPTPHRTITSTPSESTSRPQHSKKSSASEDDFSFPLKPLTSSEHDDARTTQKPNPWDLD